MNLIAGLKLLPNVKRISKAVKAFQAAGPGAKDEAGRDLVLAVMPALEGFLGRPVVDHAKLARAVKEGIEAFEAGADALADFQGKQPQV